MDIRNFEEVFEWLDGVFVEGLYPGGKYNDDEFSPREVIGCHPHPRSTVLHRCCSIAAAPPLLLHRCCSTAAAPPLLLRRCYATAAALTLRPWTLPRWGP